MTALLHNMNIMSELHLRSQSGSCSPLHITTFLFQPGKERFQISEEWQ